MSGPNAEPVSPGLTAGGGLKPRWPPRSRPRPRVSPGLTAGGGLKHSLSRGVARRRPSFPRPHRRGRIETELPRRTAPVRAGVSPGITAGGGLKHVELGPWFLRTRQCGFPRPHRRGRIETYSAVGVERSRA